MRQHYFSYHARCSLKILFISGNVCGRLDIFELQQCASKKKDPNFEYNINNVKEVR